MTVSSTWEVTPLNKQDEQILELLARLKKGQYIGDLDDFGVLRPTSRGVKKALRDAVVASLKPGHNSIGGNVWLLAPRGGGKTETLALIERELTVEKTEDLDNLIVVSLNLKDLSGGNEYDLQETIFEKATVGGQSTFKTRIDGMALKLSQDPRHTEQQARLISLGLSLFVKLVFNGASVPGLDWLTKFLFRTGFRWYRLRESNIKRMLQRDGGIDSPEALILLTKWIRYSVQPTQDRWDEFEDVFQDLSDRGILFSLFCWILEKSGYATMVLLIDEADQLVEGSMTDALMRLWDSPMPSSNWGHGLNTFFVMAGTPKVLELQTKKSDDGFRRRFMDEEAIIRSLGQPSVSGEIEQPDDFARATEVLENLLDKLPGANIPQVGDEVKLQARRDLASEAKEIGEPVTWNRLWTKVCRLYGVYPISLPVESNNNTVGDV